MIRFMVGNLFESNAFALVNTVNCEGYMGKGIAYQFKLHYPRMNADYVRECKSHRLKTGKLHVFEEDSRLIVNFPTKNKWREKSKMDYIDDGLDELVKLIQERKNLIHDTIIDDDFLQLHAPAKLHRITNLSICNKVLNLS